MLTDLDIEQILYDYIKDSDLAKAVTGGLEKTPRPKDSKGEDIVISVIANDGGIEQSAIAYVNIYVADTTDASGQAVENRDRLKVLAPMAERLLRRKNGGYYIFTNVQHIEPCAATGEHIIANRITFQIINNN